MVNVRRPYGKQHASNDLHMVHASIRRDQFFADGDSLACNADAGPTVVAIAAQGPVNGEGGV